MLLPFGFDNKLWVNLYSISNLEIGKILMNTFLRVVKIHDLQFVKNNDLLLMLLSSLHIIPWRNT